MFIVLFFYIYIYIVNKKFKIVL